jgi:hypothetical protein
MRQVNGRPVRRSGLRYARLCVGGGKCWPNNPTRCRASVAFRVCRKLSFFGNSKESCEARPSAMLPASAACCVTWLSRRSRETQVPQKSIQSASRCLTAVNRSIRASTPSFVFRRGGCARNSTSTTQWKARQTPSSSRFPRASMSLVFASLRARNLVRGRWWFSNPPPVQRLEQSGRFRFRRGGHS